MNRVMYLIPFNQPPLINTELDYIKKVLYANRKTSGDGEYTKICTKWFEDKFNLKKFLLTTSCTHALDMSALLMDIKPGDEVIMPSFTFVSTANAFALRGAKIVFVDIRPDTMNIDEKLIDQAITNNTKAIVPVHYAGISCEMDTILKVAHENKLMVVEDAAQGVMSKYKGNYLGSLGDFGCFSFHETKNFSMGEGGGLLIKDNSLFEKSEIIREKGTNRSKFYRGEIDKYTWVDIGSSYLPSEINAAYLYAQLEVANEITNRRLYIWNKYYDAFKEIYTKGFLEIPIIPKECMGNGHLFYLKLKDINQRQDMINYLKKAEISSVFHYIPLHSSIYGKRAGIFSGEDKYTTMESERLLRLPLFYNMTDENVDYIINKVIDFFKNN